MALANPAAPTTRPVTSLRTGDLLYIKGVAQSGTFEVNLETENNDAAFHFNPRFNTRIGDIWGGEERGGGFPFHEDQPFEIVILVHDAHYKVAVNGAHYTDYNHRIRKEDIRQLVVKGDVQQLVIRYQEANPYGYVPNRALPSDMIFNPTLPYEGTITGGLARGMMIRITGVRDGEKKWAPSVTAITGRSLVVDINAGSENNGDRVPFDGWSIEERHGPNFPFSKKFDIIVLVEAKGYKVAVDENQPVRHKISWRGIDHLNVSGNAQIFMIQVQ